MRVLVTGSRQWRNATEIRQVLERAGRDGSQVTVVHGGAKGADVLAGHIARSLGYQVEEHIVTASDWAKSRSAGLQRNQRMVDLGADVCVAFQCRCDNPRCPIPEPHGTHGTNHCVNAAAKAGIKVVVIKEGW